MSLSSFIVLLLSAITILQTTMCVDASDIDDIVTACENKVKSFADTEKTYISENQGLPMVFIEHIKGEPQAEVYDRELKQRHFECVADMTKEYPNENPSSSPKYRSLVQQCRAARPPPNCDASSPYYTINGTCNNLLYPKWGSTSGCFRRLWPANYEGVSGFRKSVQGNKPLPNARLISLELITAVFIQSEAFNALFAFFGQPCAHDLAQFVTTSVNGNGQLDCCKRSEEKDPHPQCAPIEIYPKDTFYTSRNVHCLNFVRSRPCDTCSTKKRIQLNGVTSWFDCSFVYGSTDEDAQKIRRNDGSGKLKSQYTKSGEELLPPDRKKGSTCGNTAKKEYCFLAGDARLNQQTPLMIFQTLFFREHNRIADRLKIINPHWDEEKLYQESRKIVIDEWQWIVYNEYLPVLLGKKIMSKFGLNVGNGDCYDPSINPQISNEFNGAAFRVHSILPRRVVYNEKDEELKFHYSDAPPLYNDRMSAYLYKMANIPGEKYDWFMPKDVTEYLERPLNGTYGTDLAAIDIQRGRDIGLPSYVQVIKYLKKQSEPIETFDDLKDIAPDCIDIFKKLYKDVRDIDLTVGLMCEKIPDGMIISPTAAKIIADQFRRAKCGDRFFLENDYTLTPEQKKELFRSSMSKLICDNTRVKRIQGKAFLFPSKENPFQSCSEIPAVDLEKWKE